MVEIVRDAFRSQADWCTKLGSPFTARVCSLCAERLTDRNPIAAAILNWPGDPFPAADSLPLRVAGALHYLARNDAISALPAVYPPNIVTDDELWKAIELALNKHADVFQTYLASAPQTNEVMRSAALMPGLLKIAELTQLPLDLYEIGASAGLNLIADRYRYRFDNNVWGDPSSPVSIEPQWQGPLPPLDAVLKIDARQGCDLNPNDLRSKDAQQRLLSYVWADQDARLQRLSGAISLWQLDPPAIARADAAQWLESSRITLADNGKARVLFHSITWSYFAEEMQQRISTFMQQCGASATVDAPLAWLRYELGECGATLRLMLWPTGGDILLATGHPHGANITWLG
jgi:hypothetical protein